jgi:eukaryotic-like serine/threonine-protein kinase
LSPFWSPDSSFIAFATGGKLKKVSVNGGPVTPLCDIPGQYVPGGSWSVDSESIVFTGGSPSALYTVPASGGSARLLLSPEMLWQGREGKSLGPRSGSEWIAQPHFARAETGSSIILFTWFGSEISLMALDLRTGQHRVIGPGSHPFYSSTGHLLYRSGTDLWGRPFSLKDPHFSGDAFLVARNATDPTAATDGTLVYRDVPAQQLVWLDRVGNAVRKIELPANGIYYPALSPDGRRVAAETWEKENLDVWISDIDRGARIRLTSHPATEVVPVWSPHGDEVAFSSYRTGNTDIFVRRADSSAEEVRLTSAPQDERVSDWSRNGQYILYSLVHPKNGSDLWYLKRNGAGAWEPHALLQTPFNEQSAKFSPDGRYVAYLSDESGRDELYVGEFPSGLRKWPISSRGAAQVRWSRDGRELFYAEAGTLIAVAVRTTRQFDVGPSTRLFSHSALTVWRDPDYDVSLDGQTFVLPQTPASQEPMIHVVQNWFAEFRAAR